MKKVILSLLLFFIPSLVKAASYDVSNYYIKAEVLHNGNMQIEEILVLDGTFNGYERDLEYGIELDDGYDNSTLYQASGIKDIKVEAKYIDTFTTSLFTDTNFTTLDSVSYASNGEVGKYILSNLNKGYRIRMYYPASNEKVAFRISYTLEDVVILHNDVAELYWPFIGDGFVDNFNDVDIVVTMPGISKEQYLRVWAHGPLYGDVKMTSDGASIHLDKLESGEVVDIRMLFDLSYITDTNSLKKSGIDAFERINEIEKERKIAADALEEELLQKYHIVVVSSIILGITIIGSGIFIYFKYGKSPKANYYSKYNREFIDDYGVEVIDYLMNRKITPNALSAAIMNLIYRKNISVKEVTSVKKKGKDYEFTLDNLSNLSESDLLLVAFLFDTVGKGKVNENNKQTFTTKDLKAYASGTKTCESFIKRYTAWKDAVLQAGEDEDFFVTSNKPKIIALVMLILSIFLLIYIAHYQVDFWPSYVVIILSILLFIYAFAVYKRTLKGSEHYARWKAFKNFLNDFGSFELKELPEIILWERYLVYATIFGLADKVEKSMNVHIKELDLSQMGMDYSSMYFYLNFSPLLHSSINNAVQSAYQTRSINYANTHSSRAGSGFGGGFGGGSGFSGGGGGRGF